MQRSLMLPTAALASALALGCADQPTPSEPADPLRASFRTEQNPEGRGAFIIRGEQGAVFVVDPGSNLSALIGWTFAELGQVCAGGDFPTRLEEFFVVRPHSTPELADLHYVLRGTRLPLLVWETASFDLCGELLLLPHLTGIGNYKRTDNDLFTTGTRGNAGHEGVQGQVTSEAGERFKFSEQFHGVINKTHNKCCRFELQLRPIGS